MEKYLDHLYICDHQISSLMLTHIPGADLELWQLLEIIFALKGFVTITDLVLM